MPGRYVLRELLLEPEFMTADTKVSYLLGLALQASTHQ